MANPDTFVGPVNLGNPQEFTMLELGDKILELTSSKSAFLFRELPGDDPKQRQPDIRLAKEAFSWKQKISLIEGLNKTIDYFKLICLISTTLP